MTPKEKAEELMIAFSYAAKDDIPISSKEASLAYINERLRFSNIFFKGEDIKYWQKVKTEIEKL